MRRTLPSPKVTPESVIEGSSSHYQRRGGALFRYGLRPEERSRIEPEIVQRPYTDDERVLLLLLDAMLAVYRELPDIRAETVRVLTDGFQGRAVVPDQIVTVLDEDNEEDVLLWQPELVGGLENRQRVVGALTALRRAVVQQ